MNIENPISTIRKAVEGSAEEMAKTEFLQKPESRHYKAIFENYRIVKDYSPEMFEKMVFLSAKGKELKDNLGPELSKIFKNVSDEINETYQNKIIAATEQLENSSNLNQEELKKEIFNLTNRAIKEIVESIEVNPLIVSAFLGKEELLKKALYYLETTYFELFQLFNEFNKL